MRGLWPHTVSDGEWWVGWQGADEVGEVGRWEDFSPGVSLYFSFVFCFSFFYPFLFPMFQFKFNSKFESKFLN